MKKSPISTDRIADELEYQEWPTPIQTAGPLHKMANGAWIDIATVSFIRPQCWNDKPEVIVAHGGIREQIKFLTMPAARAYADELAALVNAARVGT